VTGLSLLWQRFRYTQVFLGGHHEPLSVVAMRVSNPDRSPVTINRRDVTPTPTGFAEIVGDLDEEY
jgi:hypothetical protein